MTSHTEKTSPAQLVHHPSDALDSFGRYDKTSQAWSEFDRTVTRQITDFEDTHPQYRRPKMALSRRSNWTAESL